MDPFRFHNASVSRLQTTSLRPPRATQRRRLETHLTAASQARVGIQTRQGSGNRACARSHRKARLMLRGWRGLAHTYSRLSPRCRASQAREDRTARIQFLFRAHRPPLLPRTRMSADCGPAPIILWLSSTSRGLPTEVASATMGLGPGGGCSAERTI